MSIPQPLTEIAEKVNAGERPAVTVRTLLSWFGAYRRSWRNVKRIRDALDTLGILSWPDFEGEYIDHNVSFMPKVQPKPQPATEKQAAEANGNGGVLVADIPATITVLPQPEVTTTNMEAQLADPAHRISRLASANAPPIRVSPDASVEQAVTLMLQNDFSQLPVMTSDREVKGLLSWKSLGSRLALGKPCKVVRECMDRHQEIASDASLFDAVRIIAEHDCVLVRDPAKTICGIVTASDISEQFQQLAQPFLILGDIENHIRYIIAAKFTVEELQSVKDGADKDRKIEDVSDLTFGEYVRLLQNEDKWAKLETKIDRKTFTDELDRVREIRNDVMHFDPDPIDAADIKRLKQFSTFLDRVLKLAFHEE